MQALARQHFSVYLPAGLNPHELLNLRRMLEIYLPEYVNIGSAFQAISDNLDIRLMPEDVLEESRYESVKKALATISGCCHEIKLKTTGGMARELFDSCKGTRPTYQQAATAIQFLKMAFDLEIKDRNFFFVSPEDYEYFSTDSGPFEDGLGEKLTPWRPVLEAFPSADYDVREAGNCFAVERHTAAAFHLMRACEVGLRAIAKAQGVAYTHTANWGDCIADIEKRRPDPLLKEALLYLRGVKNVWRNPTMHVERNYSRKEAEHVFQAVQVFMVHLATKLSE